MAHTDGQLYDLDLFDILIKKLHRSSLKTREIFLNFVQLFVTELKPFCARAWHGLVTLTFHLKTDPRVTRDMRKLHINYGFSRHETDGLDTMFNRISACRHCVAYV